MQTRTRSPTSSDPSITITQVQCKLFKDYHQTFQSRVVDDGKRVLANCTGTSYKNNVDYDRVDQVSEHKPDRIFPDRLYGFQTTRCRLCDAERLYDEKLVKLSDGGDINLGEGVFLSDVCAAK